MQTHFHAIVWMDHRQARIFYLGLSGSDEMVLHPHMAPQNIHHKANSIGSGHVHEDKAFLEQVADALTDAGEILILGPSSAKTEFAKYLREHRPLLGERIAGVEAADHPSDGEIVAFGKRHFKIGLTRAASLPGLPTH
jgi:stalled ribosome rescue protein Dom34